MLYIKVLLWTLAECMQRGTLKRREKKRRGKSDVLLLFSNTAASQRCRTSESQRGVGCHAIDLQVRVPTLVYNTVKSHHISISLQTRCF